MTGFPGLLGALSRFITCHSKTSRWDTLFEEITVGGHRPIKSFLPVAQSELGPAHGDTAEVQRVDTSQPPNDSKVPMAWWVELNARRASGTPGARPDQSPDDAVLEIVRMESPRRSSGHPSSNHLMSKDISFRFFLISPEFLVSKPPEFHPTS